MKYILEELTSVDDFKNIEDVARVIEKVTDDNERKYYLDDLQSMGYQGFDLPQYSDYCDFIFKCIPAEKTKVLMARETCCGKDVIGIAIAGLTGKVRGFRSGRLLFFWVDPNYRKTTLLTTLYKKMWAWFSKKNCANVSINLKTWQEGILNYFMNKGYHINNVELTGPVKFLEKV